jgi:hypothetical protein
LGWSPLPIDNQRIMLYRSDSLSFLNSVGKDR